MAAAAAESAAAKAATKTGRWPGGGRTGACTRSAAQGRTDDRVVQ